MIIFSPFGPPLIGVFTLNANELNNVYDSEKYADVIKELKIELYKQKDEA